MKDEHDRWFHKIHVKDVVIPRRDSRSRGYAFVILTWAKASPMDPSDICKIYSGMLDVNSRPIYLRELNCRDDTQSSNDSVSTLFIETEPKIKAMECRLSELLEEIARWEVITYISMHIDSI